MVSYTYDTWGKLISIDGTLKDTVGVKNPYRYRGYRYDSETGLYYLNSRYYNPEWGRFINADALVSTGQGLLSSNMFVYCLNNPASNKDNNGFLCSSVTDGCSTWKATPVEIALNLAIKVAEGTGDYLIGEGTAKAFKNSVRNSYKSIKSYTPLNSSIGYCEFLSFKSVPKALKVANTACKWGLGAIAVGSTIASIWDNHQNYDLETARKRDVVDGGAFVIGCGVGAIISAFALPGVAAAVIGIGIGVGISFIGDKVKESISN